MSDTVTPERVLPSANPPRVRFLLGVVLAVVALVTMTACSGGFNIQGTWRSVGTTGWGQAQPGAVVVFNGQGQANLYSPVDTYAFSKNGNSYSLSVTGMLGGTTTFRVEVIDNNHIDLYSGSTLRVKLERVS